MHTKRGFGEAVRELARPLISPVSFELFPERASRFRDEIVIVRAVISKNEPRMKAIPLNEVAFRGDLPILLGISECYMSELLGSRNNAGERGDWYRKNPFPSPFYVSPSGIRVWFVSDVEHWCRTVRLKATSLRRKRMGAFVDRPDIAARVLGL